MKTLFRRSPQSLEKNVKMTLEYFNVENVEDIDFSYEENYFELELEEEEVEDDFNGGNSRHTYTEAFDFDADELKEYLESWFSVKFKIV